MHADYRDYLNEISKVQMFFIFILSRDLSSQRKRVDSLLKVQGNCDD